MRRTTLLIVVSLLSIFTSSNAKESNTMASEEKIVIAHRGASGYLPEHTLAAKATAHAMGAHYIEQDVVMTKDNHVVVLHDPFLDRVTDVMEKFPDRYREIRGAKRWLALDFTLEEIRTLTATEGFKVTTNGAKEAIYPERFPLFKSRFDVPTLAEEIELIQGMNQSTGKNVGIYVEIKAPWLHKLEGRDISKATLEVMKSYGYDAMDDKAFVQCFDPDETRRIRTELYPELKMALPLVQLIAETSWMETMRLVDGELKNYSYDWIFEQGAMNVIAGYADAIGPWYPMLVDNNSTADNIIFLPMLQQAKKAGLSIHPFTFRKDKGHVPAYAESFEDFLDVFYRQADVQGVFTDFPDLAVAYLRSQQ